MLFAGEAALEGKMVKETKRMAKKWGMILLAAAILLTGCQKKEEEITTVTHRYTLSGSEIVSSEQSSEESSAEKEDVQAVITYEPAVEWEEPESGDWNLVLVNAITPLAEDFDASIVEYADSIMADERIIPALTAMMEAAAKDNVSIYPSSGYRSVERSRVLYEQQVQQYLDKGYDEEQALIIAAHWVAPPGTSEHHTGLAFDFLSNESTVMDETFADTKAAQWLKEHAAEYGFILRYPKDKEQITGIVFEPWHYRYVGTDAAAQIMSRELTLEEYLGAPSVGYEDIEE